MVERRISSKAGDPVSLEVLLGVRRLVQRSIGVGRGGQQVGAVLRLGAVVAIEDGRHVGVGPSCLGEISQLLVLHILIADGANESMSKVIGAQIGFVPSHDVLEATDEGVVVRLLPLCEVDEVLVVLVVKSLPMGREFVVELTCGVDDERLLCWDQRLGVERCCVRSKCVRTIRCEASRAMVPAMLVADLVLGGDLSKPVVVVDHRRAVLVAADEMLIQPVGDLEEPVGEGGVVEGHVPKLIAVPIRIDALGNRGYLPLLECMKHPSSLFGAQSLDVRGEDVGEL